MCSRANFCFCTHLVHPIIVNDLVNGIKLEKFRTIIYVFL